VVEAGVYLLADLAGDEPGRQKMNEVAGAASEQGEVERQTIVPDASNEPRTVPHAQIYLTWHIK